MGAYAKVDHALNLGARIRESFSLIKCNRLDTKRAQAKRTQAISMQMVMAGMC